jgi:hypothetical protein
LKNLYFFFFFYQFFMMYVTELLIGNYMCYFCHQLKQKQNTEWMLYKCTNTNPEQLLEQVMTILLKAQLHFTKSYYLIIISTSCQVNVIVYASEAGGILSCINKKPLRSLPHDTPD